ncbi:hypothetical protein EJB05_07256, partial [Eragrostis curvula]
MVILMDVYRLAWKWHGLAVVSSKVSAPTASVSSRGGRKVRESPSLFDSAFLFSPPNLNISS